MSVRSRLRCFGTVLLRAYFDVYPINSSAAVRIEWFDNELDAMRSFDVDTQRSLQTLTSIKMFR